MSKGSVFGVVAMAVSASTLLLGSAVRAEPMAPQEQLLRSVQAEAFVEEGDKANCPRQAALPWCATAATGGDRALPADELALIRWAETVARRTWRVDVSSSAQAWESFADAALANKKWKGDCDNMTFTVLDLLSRNGFPAERMYRVIQPGVQNPKVFHMVGVVKLSDGRFVVVGDINAAGSYAMPADFRVFSVNHVSDGMIWRDAKVG